MKLTLIRHSYHPRGTLGTIYVFDRAYCTIERPWCNNQVNMSCIPEGIYRCKRYSSTKYPATWEVTDVPGRSHILFHVANTMKDVKGCIGLGKSLMVGGIGVTRSVVAITEFKALLQGVTEFMLEIRQYKARLNRP